MNVLTSAFVTAITTSPLSSLSFILLLKLKTKPSLFFDKSKQFGLHSGHIVEQPEFESQVETFISCCGRCHALGGGAINIMRLDFT